MPKRFVAIALLVAATVFFIPSGARSAPNGKPIVIGLSIALSGEYADSAGFLKQGYDLWVKDTNAKGGLLGRPVELKIYDDQSDPQTSAKLFEKLITQDKVDLLLGPYSSAVTSAASTVAEKYQMVMLAAAAAAPGIWKRGYKYIFQVSAQSQNYYVGAIDIAKRMGYKTMDVIGEDSDYANSAVPATTAYADKNGIKTLYSQFYPVKTSDFSAFIQHVVSDNPDVFLNAGYPPEDISVLHSLRGQDANPRMIVMGIGPSQPDWPANVGKDGNWVFASVQVGAQRQYAGEQAIRRGLHQRVRTPAGLPRRAGVRSPASSRRLRAQDRLARSAEAARRGGPRQRVDGLQSLPSRRHGRADRSQAVSRAMAERRQASGVAVRRRDGKVSAADAAVE